MRLFRKMLFLAPVVSAAALLSSSTRADATAAPRTIYRCNVDGVMTFSDRPCVLDAQIYAADESRVSTYSAPAARAANRGTTRASGRKKLTAASPAAARSAARHAADCERIQSSLRDIRSNMRAGYKAREGERLKARQAKLTARWRANKCR